MQQLNLETFDGSVNIVHLQIFHKKNLIILRFMFIAVSKVVNAATEPWNHNPLLI